VKTQVHDARVYRTQKTLPFTVRAVTKSSTVQVLEICSIADDNIRNGTCFPFSSVQCGGQCGRRTDICYVVIPFLFHPENTGPV